MIGNDKLAGCTHNLSGSQQTESENMTQVKVTFPGGKKIDAAVAGHSIPTDQSIRNGGENAAPEPFQLFLASVATCAGIYAKSFCDQRDLSAPSGLEMDISRGNDGILARIDVVLHVNGDFPDRYDSAIIRAMELCAVKKQLRDEIETSFRIMRGGGQGM
jgi:ribosomal protein S12 methylthiotransferase accessory factor